MTLLGTVQPTSAFGALFQYSNLLAAAAGFVAAYAISPGRELGAGYDAAMQAKVFGPLGMTSTTFDFQRALRANHAGAYGLDIDGKPVPANLGIARDRGAVVFDFGEWRSPVASRHNPDGSVSFVLIAPGLRMRELLAGQRDGQRTLTIRDGQHEYVFVER